MTYVLRINIALSCIMEVKFNDDKLLHIHFADAFAQSNLCIQTS